ncbi:MAG: adenylate/guanylate cyclase domain-containing protein [Pseudomonadota bacterium]
MSHATLTAEIESWLIDKALIDPDITALFEKLCVRLSAVGIPLDRAAVSWPTLHPLFRAELVFWTHENGAALEQYQHAEQAGEKWLKSPFHYAHTKGLKYMRRRLTGDVALLDFDVLEDFRDKGFTDYLLTSTDFRIAEVEHFAGGKTGILASWSTKRPSGFSDDDLDCLRRIQKVFAAACHASIQKRVMANLANAYLGSTAGWRVLAGDIRRGDGDRIPAVVWYSDLRGSTRLSDTMDADDYLALLNRYFECTAQPIIDQGGEILNFIGDGVLGIFPIKSGCPVDAVARAEAAAREAMRLADEAAKTGTPGEAPLRFGIGLAIGEVMFGNIGVPSRLAFSGIGRIVNTVQRIETATKTLNIPLLATAEFAEVAPGDWGVAGSVTIQDFDRALDVYTLTEFQPSPAQAAGLGQGASIGTAAE